jgi:deoxyribose-phosphate aldolase
MTTSAAGDAKPGLAQFIEHTLLSPVASRAQIDRHCAEARTHELFAVCVHPVWVARCVQLLAATPVRVVTVVGFPLGALTTAVKVFECEVALRQGAAEIDMVLQLGALKAVDRFAVLEDIQAVVHAAGERPVKVILETAYLTDAEKVLACALAQEAGAAFVKTSTGFARPEFQAAGAEGLGASVKDVTLLRASVAERVGVKASGGIRTAAFARELIAAGANRIGTSLGPALVTE